MPISTLKILEINNQSTRHPKVECASRHRLRIWQQRPLCLDILLFVFLRKLTIDIWKSYQPSINKYIYLYITSYFSI